MRSAVQEYNLLNGKIATRDYLEEIATLAESQGQTEIALKLMKLLEEHPDEEFKVNLSKIAIDRVPEDAMPGLEYAQPEEEFEGLEKAVSPDDIYQMITDKMLGKIQEASGKGYKSKWKKTAGYLIPFNFVSKKPYRGINSIMLYTPFVDPPMKNPFFLTFNQIEKLKGKLKKDSKGIPVVYFTQLFRYEQAEPKLEFGTYNLKKMVAWLKKNKSKIELLKKFSPESIAMQNAIPILKYYNVFRGEDVEGIDFDLENFKIGYMGNDIQGNKEARNEIAELIIKNYPKPQVPIKHEGESAFYDPARDSITLPPFENFETGNDYYRTAFHELIHSTGAEKRLNRPIKNKFGTTAYAKEELVAEFGSVFSSAHAGILWYNNDNHAEYLKNWSLALKEAEEDNRFFMRAASKAQEAADFILNKDNGGVPAYQNSLKSESKKKSAKQNKEYSAQELKIVKNKFSGLQDKILWQDFTKAERKVLGISEGYKKPKSNLITTTGDWIILSKLGKNILNVYFENKGAKKPSKKKPVSKPTTNDLLEKQRNAKLTAKTKAEFEKGLKKIGFDIISYEANQDNPKDWERSYHLNYKDVTGLVLEMSIKPEGKEIEGEYRWNAIGVDTESVIDYKNIAEFYNQILEDLQEVFAKASIAEINDLRKEYASTLFKKKEPKTQLGLFGAKGGKKKKGLKSPVTEESAVPVENTVEAVATTSVPVKKPEPPNREIQEKPKPVPVNENPNSLAARMRRNQNREFNYYQIDDPDISKFLGQVEIKTYESVGISITAPQGAGKTRFAFQLINAFAKHYKVGHASMEEHPESSLYMDKAAEYIAPENLHNIDAPDISTMEDIRKLIENNDVIVIDSFEKLREIDKNVQVDKDFRKKYDGKLFIFIFQLTSDGKMRGGSKSQFDVDIVLFTEKFDDYRENYIYPDKNRYNSIPPSDLKFNIYNRTLVPTEGTADVSDVEFEEVENSPANSRSPETDSGRLIATPVMF